MDWVFVAIALAVALITTAGLAHHAFMAWLQDRAATRVQENVLAEVTRRQDNSEQVVAKLAVDWRVKFNELEEEWKKLKEHANSQYAGAVAQVQRGWGR